VVRSFGRNVAAVLCVFKSPTHFGGEKEVLTNIVAKLMTLENASTCSDALMFVSKRKRHNHVSLRVEMWPVLKSGPKP
jgi:hypothetical protein